MQLTHYYEFENQEIKLTVEFEIEDHGIGSYEFWGSHGKDVNLVPVIQDIKTDDPIFSAKLLNQDFFNQVCEEIENTESFYEEADAIIYGNE